MNICTCSILTGSECRPAHAYTYPFEPNPDWSSFYAGSAEILKYFEGFAAKYDLMTLIKLGSKVVKAVWDEQKGICTFGTRNLGTLTLPDPGTKIHRQC
jgi:cation diffusion facilitator CzcD-associated flavoprotein CzcO